MTGVQLIGKDAVLTRFEKFDTDAWAILQGKQFIVGGVGIDALAEWLDDLSGAGTTATYSLRVYDADVAPTSTTAAGNYIACVNFKLVDMYAGAGIAGHTTHLMQRIEGLEKKLDALSGADNDPPEPENSFDNIIMGWLSSPEKLGMVVGAARQLLGMPPVPGAAAALPVQAMAGFNTSTMDTDEKLQRLSVALDSLEKRDPLLVVHLEKLAKLAADEPLIFKSVIAKLDAL
jgi:hypothetical protein